MGWNHQPVLIFYSNLQAGVKEGHSLSLRFRIELWELSLVFLKQEKGKLTFSGICSCEIWDFLGIGFNDFIYFSPLKSGLNWTNPIWRFFFCFFRDGLVSGSNNISKPCSQLVSPKKNMTPWSCTRSYPSKLHPQNHTFDQCRFPGPNGADECGERGTQLPHDAGFWFTVFFYGCCGWSRCVLSVNQLIWQMYFYYALYIYM